MITRDMTNRIKIFKKIGGQTEDGDLISEKKEIVIECWAAIKKNTVKDFQEISKNMTTVDGLAYTKDTKVFLIRYLQQKNFDNSMFIEFNNLEYKILNIELDYSKKDLTMISAVRIT